MSLDLDTIRKAADLAGPVIRRVAPEDWEEFENLCRQQVEENPPCVIMLYGMYSHGKSTLVNALLGRQAAQMGKPPTTDALDDYEWTGGHCILRDTPGIQARDAHTRVADESLRQCALVAFVVESGAIEEHIVWDTLARMLKQGQKVCVLINDFDECRHRPELLAPLKDTLRRHLQAAATREGFSGDIVAETPILIVNAKQALKGRLEHKERLVEDAGLPEVEQALVQLASSMKMADVLNTLKRNLVRGISDARRQLARNDQKALLADLEMQLDAVKGKRDRARDNIERELDSKLSAMGQSLTELYESGANDKALKATLQTMITNLLDELEPVIEAETGEAAREIQNICLEYDKVREQRVQDSGESGRSLKDAMDLVKSFDWKTLIGEADLDALGREAIVNVLQQCKKWLPDLFKGIGPKTMGRWATTTVNAVGVLITVATVFYDVYNDYQAQQEAEKRARRKAEAIRDAVRNTQDQLRRSIMAQVGEIFTRVFGKLVDELTQKINEYAQQDKDISAERQVLLEAEALLSK